MTTSILNYSQSLVEVLFTGLKIVLNGVKKTFQGFMIGWMISRQTEANRTVARLLINAGEYSNDQYWEVLDKLNYKTIQSIHKEFGDA